VVLSLNEESIKEIITKVLDDFEKDPQGTINGLFDAVDEFYPAIEQMAANQDSYSDVPTYEEFKEELDLQRNQALELVSSEEQVKQLRNTIDQAINTFTSFIKINAYDTGYEIDDGNGGTDRATVNIIINITSSLTNVFNNSYSEVSGNFDVPFTIVSEGIYVFETSQYIEPCDTVMYLYDVNDNIIAMNDNYVDSYSTIVKNLGPGDYNLRVEEKSLEQLNANLTIYLKS